VFDTRAYDLAAEANVGSLVNYLSESRSLADARVACFTSFAGSTRVSFLICLMAYYYLSWITYCLTFLSIVTRSLSSKLSIWNNWSISA